MGKSERTEIRKKRFKINITLATITALVAIFFFLILPGFILPAELYLIDTVIHRGEVDSAFQDADRISALMIHKQENLDRTTLDWSAWNDLYEYVISRDPQFLADYFPDVALSNIDIQDAIILDTTGKVIYEKHIDSNSLESAAPSWDLRALLQQYPSLLRFERTDQSHTGLAVVGDQVLLVSTRPILNSSYQGPARGTLLFAQPYHDRAIKALSVLGQRMVQVYPRDRERWAEITRASVAETLGSETLRIQNLNDEEQARYSLLKDLNQQELVVVQVNSPRQLHAIGVQAGIASRVGAFAISIFLFLVTLPFARAGFRAVRSKQAYLERFETVITQSSEAMLLLDSHWNVLEINPAGRQLLNIDGQPLPFPLRAVLDFGNHLPDERLHALSEREPFEISCRRADGHALDLQISVSPIADRAAQVFSLVVYDITGLREGQEALRISEERYTLSTRGANDGLWDWDIQANRMYTSARWKEMLGFGEEELSTEPEEWFGRIHPDEAIAFQKALSEHLSQVNGHFQQEFRLRCKDGGYRWMLARGLAIWSSEGFAVRMAGSLTDISHQKELEEMLRYDALHDGLTGLANRTLILDRLRHINERKKRRDDVHFALAFIDLDRFKQINDSLGHAAGDAVLCEVARRLQTGLRSVDLISRLVGSETLARIAGDEFVILLEDMQSPDDALAIVERIQSAIRQPFVYEGATLPLTASMGLVVPALPYENPEDIIRDADIAMYQAKQQGGNTCVCFEQEMYINMLANMQIENDLRTALENDEFLVYYQPIYMLDGDHLKGFEALARWNHPYRGVMAPSTFIDIAEKTGLIIPIGYHIMREACTQMLAWCERYPHFENLVISINLSTRQLVQPNLAERVLEIIHEVGLPPDRVWLEVTENVLVHNFEQVKDQMIELRRAGVHFEIDDFGTGYSSLSYLQRLPVDGFKIDRSFIQNMDASSQQILQGLVTMGHNLKLTLVAEGVETEVQRERVRSFDCDYAQGYLMARPMDVASTERYLTEQAARQLRPA